MCVGITIIKWDSTCHSQTHGTEPPVHFCCSHYISPCFLSTSPFHSLSLSCFLFLSLSLYLCPLFLSVVARHMSSDALYQIFSSWSILLFHTISFHSSYKIHQLFTDYLLRLSSSELLEKHLFRSRANRRLVVWGGTMQNQRFRVLFQEPPACSSRKLSRLRLFCGDGVGGGCGNLRFAQCCPFIYFCFKICQSFKLPPCS